MDHRMVFSIGVFNRLCSVNRLEPFFLFSFRAFTRDIQKDFDAGKNQFARVLPFLFLRTRACSLESVSSHGCVKDEREDDDRGGQRNY